MRQHRLNARMTAKQGPVCVGDPAPTFGDRHLWTPWLCVRLPVIHHATFRTSWTARNRSLIEVDPNQFLVAKFLGHIGNGSPSPGKTKIRASKKMAQVTVLGAQKSDPFVSQKAALETRDAFIFKQKMFQKSDPAFLPILALFREMLGSTVS